MNEEQPLRGANAYGRSKIEMESAIAAEGTDIEHCIMRIGNVLGADALLTSAMSLKRGESLMIDKFGSGGGPVRSYIDPVALASVLSSLAFASSTLPRVLNVACPMPSSMVEIAEAAGLRWEWKTAPLSAHEVITLDCSKLQKIHEFSEHDSDPTEMVKRLKSTGYFK